jgi:hypothetical protein
MDHRTGGAASPEAEQLGSAYHVEQVDARGLTWTQTSYTFGTAPEAERAYAESVANGVPPRCMRVVERRCYRPAILATHEVVVWRDNRWVRIAGPVTPDEATLPWRAARARGEDCWVRSIDRSEAYT